MKQYVFKTLIVSSLFGIALPVYAQRQDSLLSGNQAGKQLGKTAQLHALVSQTFFPLRIKILPLVFLDDELHFSLNETLIVSELKQNRHFSWNLSKVDVNTEKSLNNTQVMSLADRHKLDIIVNAKIKSLSDGAWLLIQYFSGADGSVLLTKKYFYKNLIEQDISSAIQKDLKHLNIKHVNDISFDRSNTGEVHLRTSPEHMLVSLNNIPVGHSPLILRYLPSGDHKLRLEEESSYQVTRLQIITTPPGVKTSINQKDLGLTPIDLPPELRGAGEYQVSFEHKDSFQAEIRLQTKPDNVPVQLNNSSLQRTPVSFQKLKNKKYLLNILSNTPIKIEKKITIDAPITKAIEINAYKYAKLILNTSVKNARVEIDQEYRGATPFSTKISQGQHLIRIQKNRYRNEERELDLQAGQNHELFIPLKPRSTDSSIFLTPTGELTPQLNIGTKYLGFGSIKQNQNAFPSHIYGVEIDYGWPQLYRFADTFDLGIELSSFFFALHNQQSFTSFQGLGAKLQFLQENDRIPISAAIGSYINLDLQRPLAIGFLSLSRNFGDFALHLGLQTHGFNLNLGYTGWDDLRLGAVIYADSFFRLLSKENESSTTFYGIQAGYSF